MRQVSNHLRRGTFHLFLGGVFLLVLIALTVGPPTAVAIESVENGENVTVYRTSNASFESAESVEVAIANRTVEPADTVAVGDTLVVAIESQRLADAMNATNGSTTARFFTVLDGDAEFRIVQTNPSPEQNRKFAPMGRENVTVHRNGKTVYAVVETGDLAFRYRRVLRPTEVFDGERFAVQFGYDLPETWSRATAPSSPIIEFQPESQRTTDESPTSVTTTRTSSVTATRTKGETTAARSSATSERGDATRTGEEQPEGPGVPGFTGLTVLAALLALAVISTRRS